MSDDKGAKKTPLYDKHIASGARIVPFAGWSMPVQYTGIIEEHLHTRSHAGLFDICHMGEFFVKGPSAAEEIDRIVTCRMDNLDRSKCRYGFILNDKGTIIDDMIIFKITPEEFMIVVNAGTREKDSKWIREHLKDSDFIDDSDNIAKIDLQGPLSGEVIKGLTDDPAVASLGRFCFTKSAIPGTSALISRTGYTGENGYEIFLPSDKASEVWDRLLAFDAVRPVGLGARDSLRLEMGYSLYGHDIDEDHTPVEAGLMRFVYMEKDFIGKERVLDQIDNSPGQVLTGFVGVGRRSAREHYHVIYEGRDVGLVTSGAFSPCLKKGIGLCYVDKDVAEPGRSVKLVNDRVEIDAELKNPPFIKTSV